MSLTGGDIHITLSITPAEAFTGSMRSLQLPGGRFVSIQVPPRAYDRQVIRLEGMGEPQYPNGPVGAVIITLAVAAAKREDIPNDPDSGSISRPVSSSSNQDKQPEILHDTVFDPHNSPTVISKPRPFPAPTPTPPPFSPTSSRSNRRIVVIALAIVAIIIVLSSGIIFAINSSNTGNGNNANATSTAISNLATAHINATNTALAKNVAATASARAQATATFNRNNPDPYSSNMHTITLVDPLNGNNPQWIVSTDPAFGGSCQFTNNALHIKESKSGNFYECTSQGNFSNFTFEVHMKVLQGSCGGIIFRANTNAGQFYQFLVCPNILPFYRLVLYVDNTGKTARNLIGNTFPSAIKQGFGVDNILSVVANGHSILLFANHTQVGSITDSHYSAGVIGLLASDSLNTTEVAYSNARLWT